MVDDQAGLDSLFHALADPTRRRMLRALADGELRVGELAAPFDMSLEAASKHVRVLERAGLLRRRVQGRVHVCSLDASALARAEEWIGFHRRYWAERLDALQAAMAADAGGREGGR